MKFIKSMFIILCAFGLVVYFFVSGNIVLQLLAMTGGIMGLLLGMNYFIYIELDENIIKKNIMLLEKLSFILIIFLSLFVAFRQGHEQALSALITCGAALIIIKEIMYLVSTNEIGRCKQSINIIKEYNSKIITRPLFRIITGILSIICGFFIYLFLKLLLYMYSFNTFDSWNPIVWILNLSGILLFLGIFYICIITAIFTFPPNHIIKLFDKLSIARNFAFKNKGDY